jgi:hypothetical protein
VCGGRPSLDAHSGERLARAWASMPGVGLGAGRELASEQATKWARHDLSWPAGVNPLLDSRVIGTPAEAPK